MKTLTKRQYVTAALVLTFLLAANIAPAFAQAAGGGLIQPIIQWVITNIVQGLIEGGILLVGCLLLFSRHTMAGVAVMVIGAIIISQYQTLAGLVPIGN
jgi:hypothetical protein